MTTDYFNYDGGTASTATTTTYDYIGSGTTATSSYWIDRGLNVQFEQDYACESEKDIANKKLNKEVHDLFRDLLT